MTGMSLYSDERECWLCHDPDVARHHIYGGAGRRPISDREGCWVYLCPYHHNMSDFAVHFDKDLDRFFKEDCEERWCKANGKTPEDFREVFGISYI